MSSLLSLEAMFSDAPFGVLLCNEAGEIIRCNQCAAAFICLSQEEITQKKHFSNIFDVDNTSAGVVSDSRRVGSETSPLRMVLVASRYGDPLNHCRIQLTKFIEDGNEYTWMYLCPTEVNRYVDPTSEELLNVKRQSEKINADLWRFRNTLDQTKDCVFMFDAATYQFYYCNSGAKLQIGYSAEELYHMFPWQIKPEFTEDRFKQFAEELKTSAKKSSHFLTVHEHKDGHHIPVEIFLQYIPPDFCNSSAACFVAIVRDIVERKKVEQELINAKTAAEDAGRQKMEFLANMSHEIRTPMNGIVGMTELILESELTPLQEEYFHTVSLCIEDLSSIVNEILDFSKFDGGKEVVERSKTDLLALMEDVLQQQKSKATRKGLYSFVYYDSKCPRGVVIDGPRIRRMISNMLENAIKFTSTGYVEIRVSVLKQYDNLVDLRLSVIDTGIGVPETAQTRIFEDFRQADASTTRQYGGTGLGLAIVRRLADLMGGHVSVVSNAGGSEFIVSLTCEVSTPEISISPRALNAIVLKGSPSFMAYYQNLLACAGVATMAAESLEEINAILGSDALAHSKNKFILAERHSLAMNDTMLTNSLENLNIHVITCGYDTKTVSSKNNKSIICAETFFSYHELEEMMKSISFALWDTPREVKVKKSLSLEQPLSGKHALVVEDNKTNQDLICRMLKMFGTSCRTAWNGQEALDILETGDHFDFILMDCQMPVMDGYEATSVICQWKQCGKLTHIPVIGVTANVMHGDKARCFQAGMDYYLGKPVRKNLLLDTITAALIEQKMTCLV